MGGQFSKPRPAGADQRRSKSAAETNSAINVTAENPAQRYSTLALSSKHGVHTTLNAEDSDPQIRRRNTMRRRAVWTAGVFTFTLIVFNIGGIAFYQTIDGNATEPDGNVGSTTNNSQQPLRRVTGVSRHNSPTSYSGDAIVVAKIMFAVMVILSGIVLLMGVAAVRVGFVIVWQIVFMLFLAGQITETILLMNEVQRLGRFPAYFKLYLFATVVVCLSGVVFCIGIICYVVHASRCAESLYDMALRRQQLQQIGTQMDEEVGVAGRGGGMLRDSPSDGGAIVDVIDGVTTYDEGPRIHQGAERRPVCNTEDTSYTGDANHQQYNSRFHHFDTLLMPPPSAADLYQHHNHPNDVVLRRCSILSNRSVGTAMPILLNGLPPMLPRQIGSIRRPSASPSSREARRNSRRQPSLSGGSQRVGNASDDNNGLLVALVSPYSNRRVSLACPGQSLSLSPQNGRTLAVSSRFINDPNARNGRRSSTLRQTPMQTFQWSPRAVGNPDVGPTSATSEFNRRRPSSFTVTHTTSESKSSTTGLHRTPQPVFTTAHTSRRLIERAKHTPAIAEQSLSPEPEVKSSTTTSPSPWRSATANAALVSSDQMLTLSASPASSCSLASGTNCCLRIDENNSYDTPSPPSALLLKQTTTLLGQNASSNYAQDLRIDEDADMSKNELNDSGTELTSGDSQKNTVADINYRANTVNMGNALANSAN